MAETVKITGLRELNAALRELPRRVDRRVLNAALSAGGRVIANEAKSRAPVDTGALRFAIRARPVRPRRHTAEVIVHVAGAKQVERETRRGKKLVWVRAKNFVFYWLFQEFGTSRQPARPFMRPSFESKKMEALSVITDRLRDRIAAEAQKLRGAA